MQNTGTEPTEKQHEGKSSGKANPGTVSCKRQGGGWQGLTTWSTSGVQAAALIPLSLHLTATGEALLLAF